ncbi:N-acetylmuramoyl-L-alanine amidase [Actinomyces capricornis]|nr:N-acetylmuramoyl-L-alanine amidase [Actinomyces capricornis]
MSARRFLGVAVAMPLLLVGAPPAAIAEPQSAQDPAPVQILPLTTPSGAGTELGRGGLDSPDVASPGPQDTPSPQDRGDEAPAGTSGGMSVRPGLPSLLAAEVGAGVDPEADAVLLTDPLEVDDFYVAGFTWSGGSGPAEDVQIYLRVREGGAWSPWFLNELVDGGPDESTFNGTAEFITGGAEAVQASVVGSAESLPADLKLTLVPGRPQGEEVLEASQLATSQAEPTAVASQSAQPVGPAASPVEPTTAPQAAEAPEQAAPSPAPQHSPSSAAVHGSASPAGGMGIGPGVSTALAATVSGLPVSVTTREQWGANPAYMSWSPTYASASHVVVHHTAGTNNYTASQSPSIVRGIYHYHAVTLDWGDIGYNFLIDKYGQVFEGRYGSTRAAAGKMAVGAHARGANTGTMGLSMMGDYSTVAPSASQLDAVGRMAGWFLGRAGVSDATGSAPFTIKTTEKYAAGSTVTLPRILGHRDVGYTACPGNVGYSRLGQIRSIAQSQMHDGSRWVKEGGVWRHYSADGAKSTGWVSYKGQWYYLNPPGGAMATGWQKVGGSWYFLGSDGAMATGWLKSGGSWYYLSSSGAMATGWQKIGGAWYYLHPSSGAMAAGWQKIGGSWYLLGSSGAMATGWQKVGGAWYYLASSGAMTTGWQKISGTWYYLNPSNGAMATGWAKVGGSWYYLSSSGAMATGWQKISGTWYYLNPSSGAMATGTVRIDGASHSFSGSGAWIGEASAAREVKDGWSLEGSTYTLYRGGRAVESQPLRPVMAAPTASKDRLVSTMTSAYAGSGRSYPATALGRGGAPTAKDFFTIVYEEAVAEGVSPELLFAQVVKETGWLQFGGDVKVSQFNFGGLGATGGGVAGNRFPSVRVGLRAQAQHLRAYAEAGVSAGSLANPVVDPRFQYVRKGSAPYIQYLGIQENPNGGGWAASRHYGIELVKLMDQYFG